MFSLVDVGVFDLMIFYELLAFFKSTALFLVILIFYVVCDVSWILALSTTTFIGLKVVFCGKYYHAVNVSKEIFARHLVGFDGEDSGNI